MKHIVLFGAGKSSSSLIDYLIKQLEPNNWKLTVLDADKKAAESKTGGAPHTFAHALSVENEIARKQYVASADIVISLLPPALHYLIALDCLELEKNLLTASYIAPEIEQLRSAIEEKQLCFLCEMGLDPGIDHMSAMKIIDSLRRQNAEIFSFRSHCGGLVAPENDDNPWRYKVSWNPRNVVLAGKAGADFRKSGQAIHIRYEELFDPASVVRVENLGLLSYYPNRDSLSYISVYELEQANDFIRTTLRYPDFSAGWKNIISLGLTNETPAYETQGLSLKHFFDNHFQKHGLPDSTDDLLNRQLRFLGAEDDITVINKGFCSAADVMQFVLENKLVLKPQERDMIVMLHEIGYRLQGKTMNLKSQLIVKGENSIYTAMAKTVGLPLGIAAKLILQGKIDVKGLMIPIMPEIYLPVLDELETLGIRFTEST